VDRGIDVEVEIDFGTKNVNAWFDGAGPFTLTLLSPKLPYDRVGLAVSSPTATEAWFDDFVFAPHRIGCP
jgi:hypothetical protein